MDIFETIYDILTDINPDLYITSQFPAVDDIAEILPFVILDENPAKLSVKPWNSSRPLVATIAIDIDIFSYNRRSALQVSSGLTKNIFDLEKNNLGIVDIDSAGFSIRRDYLPEIRRVGAEFFIDYRPE